MAVFTNGGLGNRLGDAERVLARAEAADVERDEVAGPFRIPDNGLRQFRRGFVDHLL